MTTNNASSLNELSRNATAEAMPPEALRPRPVDRFGLAGLSLWAGFLNEEYLSALRPWSREVRVYLEMRDYPVCGVLLDAIKLPLLGADITVQSADDSAQGKAAAEFVEANMYSMRRQNWNQHVMDALEVLDFGFAIPEIILEKRNDGHLWVRNLEARGQETLIKWFVDPENPDEAIGYMQGGFRSGQPIVRRVVPLSKTLHFTYRGRKGSPQGRSLLRSVYRSWRFASNIETFEGIGVERDVGGMPVLHLPEGVKLNDPEVSEAKNHMKGLRMDEEVFIVLPHGYELTPYQGASRTFQTEPIIQRYHKQILMRGFAQFLQLGMESVGTQALVKGSQDFFSLGLVALQDALTETWNHKLIPYLMNWNPSFGIDPEDEAALPKIHWEPPGKVDLGELVASMATARNIDALTITREDEEFIRQAAGLPDLPEGVGEDVRERIVEPLGGFGADDEDGEPGGEAEFAEIASGQQVRRLQGRVEKAVNTFQRQLGRIYEPWAKETMRQISLPGRAFAEMDEIMDARLNLLAIDLKTKGRAEIGDIAFRGLGKLAHHAEKPQVLQAINSHVVAFEQYVDGTLIEGIRKRIFSDMMELGGAGSRVARTTVFKAALEGQAPKVAFSAGQAWAAVFNVQRAAGNIEDAERQGRGEPPVPVRWVLDPRAEHCSDDPSRSTFGCPTLATTYKDGWSSLPTVPAGDVSCLGNCRCHIEADFGSGFERV